MLHLNNAHKKFDKYNIIHYFKCIIQMERMVTYIKIDLENLDRTRFELSVISYSLPKHTYNTLSADVDENGELQIVESGYENTPINKSMFLFWLRTYIGDEANEDIPKFMIEGIIDANVFLIDLLVNKNLKDISIYSRGLLHYFSKLSDWGCDWRQMPHIESKKPTYRFKRFLEESYRSKDKAEHLAGGTAKAYMRAVVAFYKFYLRKGEKFENTPFDFEELSLDISSDATNMKASRKIIIQSTDLRLNIPKQHAGIIPKHLRALADHEWQALDRIIRIERMVLKSQFGQFFKTPLPVEYTLICLLMRHSGMRRKEALTFNEELLLSLVPEFGTPGYINLDIGPKQGISTKNDKEREIEIPSELVSQLHKYSLTKRFIKRKDKFFDDSNSNFRTPLFLNQSGQPIAKNTTNARWCEIRNYMKYMCDGDFVHKPHNLRSTYAVTRLFSLIDSGMPQSEALTYIQAKLGHEDIGTTLHYLRQVESKKSPEELAEIAIDHLFDIANMEGV